MKLLIQNLAKIKSAEIELNGLTVIAGDNDTGKSTVGKVLYSMFNSFCNMSNIIRNQRCHGISSVIMDVISEYENFPYQRPTLLGRSFTDAYNLGKELENELELSLNNILNKSREYVEKNYSFDIFDDAARIDDIKSRVQVRLDITDGEIARKRVGEFFYKVFKKQVNSLQNNTVASVQMLIKQQQIVAKIKDNSCFDSAINFNLKHNAVYVDNPFVMDKLSTKFVNVDNIIVYELVKRLREHKNIDLVTDIVNEKALNQVMSIVDDVIPGDFVTNDGEFGLKKSGWNEPLNVGNLSTGVKAFGILKCLLQNNQIEKQDVLILDEPEIHLHPGWQLRYAEFLVLFQKAFDLTILLTTHSPYFLNAIEVYTAKYDSQDKVNYYQTELLNNGMATLNEVTGQLNKIYSSMAAPFNLLDKMEQDLGME
ncbi:MAG: AAA family ATPase [Anaerovibrio sp.]|uniref:AAA family ATPase n=1 Tax=Anaerovibrio sp. TaxID=1872532 RepID=UPI001B1CEB52|nr:AAA family ATPase [Anaerovibrio sp.]MBO6246596.1 AAA family ATPase [Anaerovibrio sp.]